MNKLGNEIYIQKGETWSLDFSVQNSDGDPFMLFSKWENPYLAITVSNSRYKQDSEIRTTWWLDLSRQFVEQEDGSLVESEMKKFIETKPIYTTAFDIETILSEQAGGKIVLDSESDFDITNYLFYIDEYDDGNRVYKYVSSYTLDEITGLPIAGDTVWTEYYFRVVKQFDTSDWIEQSYWFDINLLCGDDFYDYVIGVLEEQGEEDIPETPWTDETTETEIALIEDETVKASATLLYEVGQPLATISAKIVLLNPTKLSVSSDIREG